MPIRAALVAALLLSGCAGAPRTELPNGGNDNFRMPFLPSDRQRLPTTEGAVYLGNLDAHIGVLEDRLDRRPSPTLQRMLAAQLLHRSRINGRLDERVRARDLAQSAQETAPAPAGDLILARAEAALHRFGPALELLDGLPPGLASEVQVLRRDIERALGRPPAQRPTGPPDLTQLAAEANALLDRDQLEAALARFHLAHGAYANSNPYPLAWLYTQIGIGYLRYGHLEAAQVFLEAALDRLPGFAVAKDHLAETLVAMGRTEQAVPLYRELVESSGDPEFCGVLASLPDLDAVEADRYQRCAETGFEQGLRAQPEAFWLHAAEYYLETGRVERGLALARRNAEHRRDTPALLLLARASAAAGDRSAVCAAIREIAEGGDHPPELREIDRSGC